VGEIACRLTPTMNDDLIRSIEESGGECTLAHIVEWVFYTNAEHQRRLRQQGHTFSKAMLAAKISNYIQHRDEHRLSRIFADDLLGYEEPPVEAVLRYSEPYLPASGALGEMTLSVGKAVFHYHQGCDGVVDISPFGCMNGIVTEAVYPRVSADCDEMPIRNFFFDGTGKGLGHPLGVFMELARSYQARKTVVRVEHASVLPET
jgi:predicted nucleotide-binding protein (sugar kinase/HSP70/actin superfamily)